MSTSLIEAARQSLTEIEAAGTLKKERLIYSPQSTVIRTGGAGNQEVSPGHLTQE